MINCCDGARLGYNRRVSELTHHGGLAQANMDPRTRLLLEAPIARTLLKLGAPNVLVMFAQAAVGLIEAYFVIFNNGGSSAESVGSFSGFGG